tara:strand:- start:161 stop:427 length:267 start_codon:yes stop_codon:yes gene_type:complete
MSIEIETERDRCLDVIDNSISQRLTELLDNDKYDDAKAIAQEMFLCGNDPEEGWDDSILFLTDITGLSNSEIQELEWVNQGDYVEDND